MHRKSIIGSLTIILLGVILIYVASTRGRFSFIPSATGYASISEFSAVTIFASFVVFLVLFVLLYRRKK